MRQSPAGITIATLMAVWLSLGGVASLHAQRTGPMRSNAAQAQSAWGGRPHWRAETLVIGEVTGIVPVGSGGSRNVGGGSGPQSSTAALQARVRVQRVLHGNAVREGDALTVSWPVIPAQIPRRKDGAVAVESPLHALFVLDKQRRPLWVRYGATPSYLGGYFIPLPAEVAAHPKQPLPGSSQVEGLLVAEAFAVLEYHAGNHARQLDEAAAASQRAGWYPSIEAGHFQQWSAVVGHMDPMPFREELRRLLASDSPHLRMVGIHGLLGLNDLAAMQELEQDFEAYQRAMRPPQFFQKLSSWSVAAQPRSVDAAGRLALHEDIDPVLEASLTQSLTRAGIPDSLPYLVTLLASPHATTHTYALEGVCRLAVGDYAIDGGDPNLPRRPAMLTGYAPPGASGYCRQVRMRKPDGSPASNADRAETARFWQAWWGSNQSTLASDFRRNERGAVLPFGEARAPTRWLDAERPVMQEQPGGPRVALQQLLYPFRPNSLRGDAETMLRRMMGPQAQASRADWKVAAQVLETHARTLQAVHEQYDQVVRQVRSNQDAQGGENEALAAATRARQQGIDELLDACLRELEAKLSPRGWADFQEMLKQRAAQQRQYRLAPNRPGTATGP